MNASWLPRLLLCPLAWAACGDNRAAPGGDPPLPPPPPPPPEERLGEVAVLTSAGRIVTFDRAAWERPTSESKVPLAPGERLLSIDFRPADGALYGLTSAGRIGVIDPVAGTFQPRSVLTTALVGTELEIDFDPVLDRLHVASDAGVHLSVDPATGAAVVLPPVPSLLGIAFENAWPGACRTRLVATDPARGELVVGGARVRVPGVPFGVGFDIATAAAAATAATAATTADTAVAGLRDGAVYVIDLATGAATNAGQISLLAGEAAIGVAVAPPLTAVPQAPGPLIALTESQRLITFERAAPHRSCTSAPITGAGSDELVALDARPSDGALYALGRSSTVYRLALSGAASSPVALDRTLDGTAFGIDFEPTGEERLRIVSDSGQGLRASVSTGATTLDAIQGTAAGHTNALPGAATSTLFVADALADRLLVLGDAGLAEVGPFGVDAGSLRGLDIDGRDNTALVAIDDGAATAIHAIDLATGAIAPALGTAPERLRGLTMRPRTARVLGLAGGALVELSLTDPSAVTTIGPITGLSAGETLIGLDVHPMTGALYAIGNAGGVYAIDATTAAATPRATLQPEAGDTLPYAGLGGGAFGLDFDPTSGTARIVSDAEENLVVLDLATGVTRTDSKLLPSYGVRARVQAFAPDGTLYGIDAYRDVLMVGRRSQLPATRIVGPLGLDVTPSGDFGEGFEILAPDLALVLHDMTISRIDLATGRLTPLGDLGTPFPIAAIAAPPAAAATPDGRIFAIGLNRLFAFPRNAPAQTTMIGPLAVGAGEEALAAAFEPSTGELWVMTLAAGTARLYTVDTTTAAVTLRSTLNDTIPYGIGMDFDPLTPHTLHVASPFAGRWLVDPLTGEATAQPPLALAAPAVTAAAYTNSFAGAAGTTLLVLDLGSGHLMTAEQGALQPYRGALAPFDDFTGAAGFDIAGGDNGLVLAALQRPLEPFSRLYRIDLATGRLVEIGGGIGGAPLSGLAIRVE